MKKIITSIFLLMSLAQPLAADDLIKLRLLFDNGPNGIHAWLLRGIQDGTFKKHGLDVEYIGNGPGSVNTTLAIATGRAEIGYGDYSGIVLVNSKTENPKVVTVFVADDKVQDSIWSLKDSNIKTFDDLEGKTLGGFPTGVTSNVLPSVTGSNWELVNMPFSLRVPALISRQVDAIEGFITTNKPNLDNAGIEYNVIKLSDKFPMGVSRVISVNKDWAQEYPQAVIALRNACHELIQKHIQDPDASIDALSGPSVSTVEKRELEIRRAQLNISELILTDSVKNHGVSNPVTLTPRLNQYTSLLVEKLGLPYRHSDSMYFDLD